MSYYIKPCYNGTRLYIHKSFNQCHMETKQLNHLIFIMKFSIHGKMFLYWNRVHKVLYTLLQAYTESNDPNDSTKLPKTSCHTYKGLIPASFRPITAYLQAGCHTQWTIKLLFEADNREICLINMHYGPKKLNHMAPTGQQNLRSPTTATFLFTVLVNFIRFHKTCRLYNCCVIIFNLNHVRK